MINEEGIGLKLCSLFDFESLGGHTLCSRNLDDNLLHYVLEQSKPKINFLSFI